MATELLYLRDAYQRRFSATVVDRRDDAVVLDRTAFYPTGGGQPAAVLCGMIWNEWSVPVTGGNMEPLSARMDFEFDPLPVTQIRVLDIVGLDKQADRGTYVNSTPKPGASAW